jgi:nickel-dependent lactate racemase
MAKDKKNESVVEAEDKVSHEEKLKFVSVIAKPMASKKLTKKVNNGKRICIAVSMF